MKNSLFKRAVATVATVPLALTQSLTCSFAATDVTVPTAVAATESSDNSFTLNTLLHIAPDDSDQYSDWNYNVSNALDTLYTKGKNKGTLDAAKLFDSVSSYAGQYEDIAKAVIAKVTDANYEIKKNGDIILTAKVDDVAEALSENVGNSLGKLAQDLADKYNAPELANIDFKSVKISGSVKVTVESSRLAAGTKVPVSFEYTPDETKKPLGPEATVKYAKEKLAELKQKAYDAIEEVKDHVDVTAAKKDVDSNVARYEKALNKASNAFDRFLNANKEGKFDSVAKLIERVNNWNQLTKRNKQIPANGAAIAANEKVQKYFTKAKNFFNNHAAPYTLDVEAKDLGEFADKLYGIDTGLTKGQGTFIANFPEDEFEALDAYFAEKGEEVDHENTYKQLIINVDGSKIKESGFTVNVKVKRILVTKPIETTTTTTTEETTTTTTTEETTSSTTTDEVTSTTTTDEETTTSTTTEDVTSSTTTDEETTTYTTTEDVTSSTTTDEETTSSTTTEDVTDTTTSTTSTDTTSVTETDVTTTTAQVLKVSLIKDFKPYVDNTNADPDKRGFSAKYGFYTQIDKEFSKDQVDKLDLKIRYTREVLDNGKVKEVDVVKTLSVLDKFNYGDATPQNKFDLKNKSFKYEGTATKGFSGVKLYASEDIKFSDFFEDEEGIMKLFADKTIEDAVVIKKGEAFGNDGDADFAEPLAITVYIGVKGDADLDGRISADDASLALRYFTQLSNPTLTDEQRAAIQLSSNSLAKVEGEGGKLVDDPTGIYDNFAAFLIDTFTGYAAAVPEKDNWRFGKKDMFSGSGNRVYDATDASYILRYFTWASGQVGKELSIADQAAGWDFATGKTV